VHMPGHTGGHCSLLSEAQGVLFAGDALSTVDPADRGARTSAPALQRGHRPGLALARRLRALDATLVVVGHGEPFDGSPAEAVEQLAWPPGLSVAPRRFRLVVKRTAVFRGPRVAAGMPLTHAPLKQRMPEAVLLT
jgi:glyoxylase-like metal-dependent hydrolase (beta-lactamase superfamily II)